MKAIGRLFGGGKPKPDKRLQAMQRRQMQEANNERAELEAEKSDVASGARRARSGRRLLSYVRKKGASTLGGG